MLLLSTQFWPQTANVQRLQCESVRAVSGWCDHTEAAVAFLWDAFRLRLQMLCDGAITCCHTWKGQNCIAFRKKIKAAILNCYPTVSPIVIYTTRPAFRSIAKDVSPTLENSNFIYKYACRCERTYVGETCQRFSERIKQHIPDKLYKKPPDKRVATSDSAITKHLQAQPECIPQERNSSFSVITPARNSAHRFTLEALYIRSLRPELCRQKKHIKVLRLFKLQPD